MPAHPLNHALRKTAGASPPAICRHLRNQEIIFMGTPRTIRSGLFGAMLLACAALQTPLSHAAETVSFLDLKVPSVFLKPAPEGVDDLKAIQNHVNRVIKEVMPAVVNVKIG